MTSGARRSRGDGMSKRLLEREQKEETKKLLPTANGETNTAGVAPTTIPWPSLASQSMQRSKWLIAVPQNVALLRPLEGAAGAGAVLLINCIRITKMN